MQEWRLTEQPPGLQVSVRRVLGELKRARLLRLRDKRLEARAVGTRWYHSVWAYFPILPRWASTVQEMAAGGITFNREVASVMAFRSHVQRAYGKTHEARNADEIDRVRIVRELLPRPDTRAILVFGTAGLEEEGATVFEDHLRDHLGHVLLYLRAPKAWNGCSAAMKEWRASIRARPRAQAPKQKR